MSDVFSKPSRSPECVGVDVPLTPPPPPTPVSLQLLNPNYIYDGPPEFLVPLTDVTCDSGESVTLRCKVCGRPRASVTWRGPDQSALSNNGHFSMAHR